MPRWPSERPRQHTTAATRCRNLVTMFDIGLLEILIFLVLFVLVVWAGVSILRRR